MHGQSVIVYLVHPFGPLTIHTLQDAQTEDEQSITTIRDLKQHIDATFHIPFDIQQFTLINGHYMHDDDAIVSGLAGPDVLSLRLSLPGGKGGFGSMLRAQGGRMASQKTTNFDACRDLSGRRIKTINEAKKLADTLAAQPELDKEKLKKLNDKIAAAQAQLQEDAPRKKYRFDDHAFLEAREEVVDGVRDAITSLFSKEDLAGVTLMGSTSSKSSGSSEEEDKEEDDANGEDEDDDEEVDDALGYWDSGYGEYGSASDEEEEEANADDDTPDGTKDDEELAADSKGKTKGKGKKQVAQGKKRKTRT